MNEWRGALGAYVQKLGEYDLLCSDDDEKEPALRAELLSTVLKSGTVSSRGAWGDKDWSQPQWLVLAPSRCDSEGGVAADPFLAALRDFPGDDGSFEELEVWRVSLASLGAIHRSESEPRVLGLECADGARVFVECLDGDRDDWHDAVQGVAAVCKALRNEDQLETIEEASDEESDEGSRRAADASQSADQSPDDDARRRRAAEKSARWAVSARSPIRDDPEALEDIYAEASASGVGADDLTALVHALHDARRSRRDDDSLDDVSTQGTVDAGAIEGELEVTELRERTRRAAAAADATTTACELDDLLADGRSCGLETELANKLEGLRANKDPAFVAARLETATAAPLLCQSAAALLDLAEAADAVLSPELARDAWVHRNRHARALRAFDALRAAAPGDDREAIFQAIAALAVEAPRLTEAEETIVMTARAKVLALDRRDAVVQAVKDAADDEDASLDKLREALTYAKELPRTADVVRLEARVAARAPDDALFQARDAAAKVEALQTVLLRGAAWGLEARELAVIDDRRRTILAAGVAVAEGIVARVLADKNSSRASSAAALEAARPLLGAADVAELEARVVLETKREAARARVRGDDGGGDDSATGLLLRAQRWTDALAECEAAELPPDELRAVARKRDAYAAGAAALDALAAALRAEDLAALEAAVAAADASAPDHSLALVAKRKIAALRARGLALTKVAAALKGDDADALRGAVAAAKARYPGHPLIAAAERKAEVLGRRAALRRRLDAAEQGEEGAATSAAGLRRRAATWQALVDEAAPLFGNDSDEAARARDRRDSLARRAAQLDALDDAVDRDDLDAIEACVDAMPSSPAADRGLRRAEALRAERLARDEAADLEDAHRAALDAERDSARVAAVADAGLAAAQRVGSPATLARAVEALGRDASPDKARLAAHVLSTRTRVADALATASAPGDLVRACLRAERTGHPRDERAYAAARRALRSAVLASGALYVTRSSLGLDPDDRDDERRHVALVAGSFDGATGAYLGPALLCSRDGNGDGPGDGGEYLLDGAALEIYAREDRCCFDVRVDGVPPLELAAAGAAERDAWTDAVRGALAAHHGALAEYDDLDAEASEARQRLLRAARCGGPGDAAAAPGFHASRARAHATKPGLAALRDRVRARAGDAADAETLDALRSEAAVLGLGGTADALSARLDVEALLDADVAGADDLDGLVLAIDRARFGGVGLDSPAYTRAVAKGERLLAMQQARDELALLRACEDVAALVEAAARARAAGLPDEELAVISAQIDALCEAQERAFGTPKSGDRAVPVRPTKSTAKKRAAARAAVAAAVAEAGSFTLVADALVATYKSDAAAWPPRALVDAVSAAPPLIRGPLAVRLEVHGEWTACDDAKLYGVTFQGDALAGPVLRVRGEFLPLRDCRVDEAPPGADHAFAVVHAKTPRLLVRADDGRRWVGAVRRALAAHVDLLAQLRAVSLKRRTVDRAEARGVARDLFATRGAEVSA